MNLSKRTKIALGIAGSIIVGALGSGLWNGVLGPSLSVASKGILNLVTFGISSLKDNMYRRAAQGLHEVASIEVNAWIIAFLAALAIMFVLFIIFKRKIAATIATANPPSADRFLTLAICLFALIASKEFVTFLANYQANLTTTHFQQCLKICRPLLKQDEELRIESEFAQIQNKEDYVRVVGKLENLGREHNLRIPKFDPW